MKATAKGIMLINLGSPDSYSISDVRKYLREFLMDEKVIDLPILLRQVIVNGFIVPFRAPKTAKAYQSIWTNEGSPLKVITENFKNILLQKVDFPVAICMRYGNPNPASALRELESKVPDLDEILIAPMYPHYAMSSYETALEHARKSILSVRKDIKLRALKPFFNEPSYISALASSIKPFLLNRSFDAFLFSYHGLPVRHLKKTDPTKNHCYVNNNCCEITSLAWNFCYKHQVKQTTRLAAEQLYLDASKVVISFQSRLGSDKWLQPFTDKMLQQLPGKGVKKLLVVCPSFVADCLETLEEMNERGKKAFLENGGEEFISVPCLNTSPEWVDAFSSYCNYHDHQYSSLWTQL